MDNIHTAEDVSWCEQFFIARKYKFYEILLYKCSCLLVTNTFIESVSNNNHSGDLSTFVIAHCEDNYDFETVKKLFLKHKNGLKTWRVCGNSGFSDMELIELSCLVVTDPFMHF